MFVLDFNKELLNGKITTTALRQTHLDSLLLEDVQLSTLLNSVVGKLLLEVENLVTNHDLHLIGGQMSHRLGGYHMTVLHTEIFFLRERRESVGSTSRS